MQDFLFFPTCKVITAALKSALHQQYTFFSDMSQHASLKKSSSIGAKRSVLKRFERIKLLQKRGEWEKGMSPLGLPKTEPEA